MVQKKWEIFLVIILAFILIASGCSNASESDGASNNELSLTWWGSKQRNDATVKVTKDFEENQNIEVETQFSGWQGYWSKLSTQVGGGTPPDVIQMDQRYLRNYANRSALLKLSDSNIDFSNLDQSILKSGQLNDQLYAIPTGVNTLALMYDPDMLEKAGIDVQSSQRMTWTDYANMARNISKKLPEQYGTPDYMGLFPLFKYFVRDHGEQLFSDDGKSLEFSKRTMTEWFNYWLKLIEEGVAEPADASASYNFSETEKTPLVTGKSPISIAWSNQFASGKKLANRPLEMALLPKSRNGESPYFLHPNMYWAVSKSTNNEKNSEKLVDFLINNQDVVKAFGSDRGVPINKNNREQLLKHSEGEQKQEISFVNKVSEIVGPTPPVPPMETNQLVDLLHKIAEQVAFGQLPPKDATNQFLTEAESILK